MSKRIQTTILLVAIAASNISIVHSQLNIRTIDVAELLPVFVITTQ